MVLLWVQTCRPRILQPQQPPSKSRPRWAGGCGARNSSAALKRPFRRSWFPRPKASLTLEENQEREEKTERMRGRFRTRPLFHRWRGKRFPPLGTVARAPAASASPPPGPRELPRCPPTKRRRGRFRRRQPVRRRRPSRTRAAHDEGRWRHRQRDDAFQRQWVVGAPVGEDGRRVRRHCRLNHFCVARPGAGGHQQSHLQHWLQAWYPWNDGEAEH